MLQLQYIEKMRKWEMGGEYILFKYIDLNKFKMIYRATFFT